MLKLFTLITFTLRNTFAENQQSCFLKGDKMWVGEDTNQYGSSCGNVPQQSCEICPSFYHDNVECYDIPDDVTVPQQTDQPISCENENDLDCLTKCDKHCDEIWADQYLTSSSEVKMFCCIYLPSLTSLKTGTCSYRFTYSKFYSDKQPSSPTTKTKLYSIKKDQVHEFNGQSIEFNDPYKWESGKFCHDPILNSTILPLLEWPDMTLQKTQRGVVIPPCDIDNGDNVEQCKQKCQAFCETVFDHNNGDAYLYDQFNELAYCCVYQTGKCQLYSKILGEHKIEKELYSQNDNYASSAVFDQNIDYQTQLVNSYGRPIYWFEDQQCKTTDQSNFTRDDLFFVRRVNQSENDGFITGNISPNNTKFQNHHHATAHILDQCRLKCIEKIRFGGQQP